MLVRWLVWVTAEWTMISAALLGVWYWPWFIPFALIIVGSRQHALAILGHEGTHWAVCGHKPSNDRFTNLLAFWPIGVDVSAYRTFHIAHHLWLGTVKDPELGLKALFAERWEDLTAQKKVLLLSRDVCGMNMMEASIVFRVFRGRHGSGRILYLAAILLPLAYFNLWLLLLVWLVALPTTHFAFQRARMWKEHVGTTGTLEYIPTWWERCLYLPHYTWRHALHHRQGSWSKPGWELHA